MKVDHQHLILRVAFVAEPDDRDLLDAEDPPPYP
jgi:hypothetical protein